MKPRPPVTCPHCNKVGTYGMQLHIKHCDGQRGIAEFWKRVTKQDDGCWIYRGHTLNTGHCDLIRAGRKILAHRYSWQLHNGPIPAGLLVLHHCDVPACVNPAHLYLGTDADNARDKIARGRTKHGASNHKAKLREEDIPAIRAAWNGKRRSNIPELARRYGVGNGTIRAVLIGKTWKHTLRQPHD